MNAATALAKTQQTKLDTIEGRTPARFTVALLVTFVAGIGVWGALSAARGMESYKDTKRLENAYAKMLEIIGRKQAQLLHKV